MFINYGIIDIFEKKKCKRSKQCKQCEKSGNYQIYKNEHFRQWQWEC